MLHSTSSLVVGPMHCQQNARLAIGIDKVSITLRLQNNKPDKGQDVLKFFKALLRAEAISRVNC